MLHAISPIDGRYASKTSELAPYFSEYGLIRQRVLVEVEYFIALCGLGLEQLPELSETQVQALRNVYKNFNDKDAQKVKDTEAVTNHDVKAVEYFVKDALSALDLGQYVEWIHFGLTSQDINNTSMPLLIKGA